MAGRDVSVRTLRIVKGSLLGMVLIYALIGEALAPKPGPVNPVARIVIYFLAASLIPSALLLRGRELKRARERLTRQPEYATALRRWRVIQLAILASFEAIPLYGLVLRFMGGTQVETVPFFFAGFLLLVFLPLHEADQN